MLLSRDHIWNLWYYINPQHTGKTPKDGDFSRGPAVKNLPCSAGNVSSIPGWGTKISHAAGQLSPHSITTEPVCLNERSHVQQLRPEVAK